MDSASGHFYGRTLLSERIQQALRGAQPESFVLVGARLIGKSMLLRNLHTLSTASQSSTAPDSKAALVDCALMANAEELWQQLYLCLKATSAATAAPPTDEPAARNNEPYHHLLDLIAASGQQKQRPLLLLDNFDHLLAQLDDAAQLCTQLYPLTAQTVLVLATVQPLYDMQPTLAATSLLTHTTQLFLGLLEPEAVSLWLKHYQARWPTLATIHPELVRMTGRHPFLLAKLGESLTEIQQMLAAGALIQVEHLPLVQLRLAEQGRPLFLSLLNELLRAEASQPVAARAMVLLKQLQGIDLTLTAVRTEHLAAINWLINQALIIVQTGHDALRYTIFSPLFASFLAVTPPPSSSLTSTPSPVYTTALSPAFTSTGMAIAQQNADEPAIYEQLTKIEGTLLRYFQKHSHTLIPSEQLLTEVWKRPQATDRRVQEAIRRLRLQLEQVQPSIGEIRNERGRGYRFIPALNGV